MQSIRELFRTGRGPSSSHTMAPHIAAEKFKHSFPNVFLYRVTLFGSLAATGKGHQTDKALEEVFENIEIVWKPEEVLPVHPNGMLFEAVDEAGIVTNKWEAYSIGGGAVLYDNISPDERDIYDLSTMTGILKRLEKTGESFWEYVEICEGEGVWDFLKDVWHTMNDSIDRGLAAEGALPGGLGLARKAHSFYRKASVNEGYMKHNGIASAYALAVAEENASGHIIVTAPTCGASGCMPAVIRHTAETIGCCENEILKALATSALIGNLIKTNASISGAEVGCQGEIGASCSMAAAAATQLMGGTVRQIEYAAEMGLEHNLGLTCDPVKGLVQIPCIERNAHAAVRSLSCSHYSLLSDGSHRISFDDVVAVMRETGNALPSMYRETSKGGLAQIYRDEL